MSNHSLTVKQTNKHTLDELIYTLRQYSPVGNQPLPDAYRFIRNLRQFINVLDKINQSVGLTKFKQDIADKVKSFAVNYKRYRKPVTDEKLHVMLFGFSGTGKTHVGKLLAEFWAVSGCIDNSPNKPENQQIDTATQNTILQLQSRVQRLHELQTSTLISISDALPILRNIRRSVRPYNYRQKRVIDSNFDDLEQIVSIIYNQHSIASVADVFSGQTLTPLNPDIQRTSANILPVIVPKQPGNPQPIINQNVEKEIPVIFGVIQRGDLVGKFVGHTTDKVRQVLDKYIGGAVLIDEFYNICTSEMDTFGMEILDELIKYMSLMCNRIVFIFAGYESHIRQQIMSVQPGFIRRVQSIYHMESYTPEELTQIYVLQLNQRGMNIKEEHIPKITKTINDNMNYFPQYAGDTERLADFTKDVYYSKVWVHAIDDCLPITEYMSMFNNLDYHIFELAYEKYIINSHVIQDAGPPPGMYS